MHIRYKALENKKIGTHSWYAQPDYTGTLTMDDIIERACRSSTLSEGEARLAMDLIQDTIKSYLLRGYRCQLGRNFLTIYPNIQMSVKDTIDKDGNLIIAKEEMLNANSAKASVECTVHPKFSKKFNFEAKWEKGNY